MLIKTNKIIVIEAESVSPSLRTWTQEPQKTGRDKQKSYMICYDCTANVLTIKTMDFDHVPNPGIMSP